VFAIVNAFLKEKTVTQIFITNILELIRTLEHIIVSVLLLAYTESTTVNTNKIWAMSMLSQINLTYPTESTREHWCVFGIVP